MSLHVWRQRRRRYSRRLRAQLVRITTPGFVAPWGAQVGRWCRIQIEPTGLIQLGCETEIDDGTTLVSFSGAQLILRDHTFVGHHCTIAAAASIEIGEGTYLAELVSIRDHDHDHSLPLSQGQKLVTPVIVGKQCWLASKVTVVRGSVIGDHAVIGANSVVLGAIPANVVAVGSPAKAIRQRTVLEQIDSA
jgi:acetyltransferase-like isoleucine patch superfamily enzyme